MAEYVQHNVEQMLPELEKMQHLALFSNSEIKCIIRKHRHYEYQLRRRVKGKEEYLQYIQYEINLLALLKKRAERTGYYIHCKDVQYKLWHRIDSLFHMVCTKYRNDIKLWTSYIDFLKETHTGKQMVSKKYNKMLQIHSTNPSVWISAAKWEMDEMNASDNARLLLQRGIRFNTRCPELWLEYFRIEIMYANSFHAEEEETSTQGKAKPVTAADEEMTDEQKESIKAGKVAMIVFREAVQSVARDKAQLSLSLYVMAKQFPNLDQVEEEIWSYINKHHLDDEGVWDYKARQELLTLQTAAAASGDTLTKEQKWELIRSVESNCCDVYDNGTKEVNNERMWSMYIDFCVERLALKTGSQMLREARYNQCIRVLTRADEEKLLGEIYYEKWIKLIKLYKDEDRCSLLDAVISKALAVYKGNSEILTNNLELQLLKCGEHCDDKYMLNLLSSMLQHVIDGKTLPMYEMLLQWARERKRDGLVRKIYLESMSTSSPNLIPLKTDYIKWVFSNKGINKFQLAYDACKTKVPLNMAFYRTAISLEEDVDRKRGIYEDAIQIIGSTDVELWLEYISFEKDHKPERVGHIHWRAMKTLKKKLAELFTQRQTLTALTSQ